MSAGKEPFDLGQGPGVQHGYHDSAAGSLNATGVFATNAFVAKTPDPRPVQQGSEGEAALPPGGALLPVGAAAPADLTGIFRKISAVPVPVMSHNGTFEMGLSRDRTEPRPATQRAPSAETFSEGFTEVFRSFSSKATGLPQATEHVERSSFQRFPALEAEQRAGISSPDVASLPFSAERAPSELFKRGGGFLSGDQVPADGSQERLALHSQPGGFTQLLRTLSDEQYGSLSPAGQPGAEIGTGKPLIEAANGPGEFTRIISGSLLREAAALRAASGDVHRVRRTEEASEPASSAVPAQASASTALPFSGIAAPSIFSAPVGFPPAALPPAPVIPLGLLQADAMPHGFATLEIPAALPQHLGPQPTSVRTGRTAEGGKLQAYLPMLLVANLFIMLLILVLLTAMLVRH